MLDKRTPHGPSRRRAFGTAAIILALGLAGLLAPPALAQGWWPFGGSEGPPVPREPMHRPEAQPAPVPPNVAPPPAPGATNWSTSNPICLQLEQRLVQDGQKGSLGQARLPQIESEIRTLDRTFNVASDQLDNGCYEYFLFTKTLRNTPKCKALSRQVEDAKRRLSELEAQRQDIIGSSERSYRDDIVRELARNNCGANYVDEARRRDRGFWHDEEAIGSNNWTPQGNVGVATYRTVCVRLCDGYYFPISFSTLPSHFAQDAESCSSRCAAPSELYYYPNPGGTVDQSVALKTQEAYTQLKVAFRYRKEYVKGCSCKAAEYLPEGADAQKKAEAPQGAAGPQTSPAPKQAAATAGSGLMTGSTQPAPAPPPVVAPTPAQAAPGEDASGWDAQVQ